MTKLHIVQQVIQHREIAHANIRHLEEVKRLLDTNNIAYLRQVAQGLIDRQIKDNRRLMESVE
jgi:hypothetical protein